MVALGVFFGVDREVLLFSVLVTSFGLAGLVTSLFGLESFSADFDETFRLPEMIRDVDVFSSSFVKLLPLHQRIVGPSIGPLLVLRFPRTALRSLGHHY